MPEAQLFIIYPRERSWVRGAYRGSDEHISYLRQQVADSVEREQQLEGMKTDIHIDLMNAIRDRRKLQRDLWALEYEARYD